MNNVMNLNHDDSEDDVFRYIETEGDQENNSAMDKTKKESEQKNWLSLPFAMLTSFFWENKL